MIVHFDVALLICYSATTTSSSPTSQSVCPTLHVLHAVCTSHPFIYHRVGQKRHCRASPRLDEMHLLSIDRTNLYGNTAVLTPGARPVPTIPPTLRHRSPAPDVSAVERRKQQFEEKGRGESAMARLHVSVHWAALFPRSQRFLRSSCYLDHSVDSRVADLYMYSILWVRVAAYDLAAIFRHRKSTRTRYEIALAA